MHLKSVAMASSVESFLSIVAARIRFTAGSGILISILEWSVFLLSIFVLCCLWRRLWHSADHRFREARPCARVWYSGPEYLAPLQVTGRVCSHSQVCGTYSTCGPVALVVDTEPRPFWCVGIRVGLSMVCGPILVENWGDRIPSGVSAGRDRA